MKIYKYLIVVALLFSNNSLIAQSCYCAFLTNFKAIQQSNNQVKVSWDANSETLSARDFVVQRSSDGITYSDIGYVSATPGTSTIKSYQFIDAYPPCSSNSNVNVSYRLKSVSIDNNTRLSSAVFLVVQGCPSCSSGATACQCALNVLVGDDILCSGSKVYEVTNASGPVTWTVSNSNIAYIVTLTSSKISLHKTTDGVVTLTAAISNCTSLTKTITVGTPPPTSLYLESQVCIGGSDWDATFQATPATSGLTYWWSVNGGSFYSSSSSTYNLFMSSDASISLDVKIQNTCGTSAPLSDQYGPTVFYSPCNWWRMSVSPNPSKDKVHVKIKKDKDDKQTTKPKWQVTLFDKDYNAVRKFETSESEFTIERNGLKPGLYYLQAKSAFGVVTKQVILE